MAGIDIRAVFRRHVPRIEHILHTDRHTVQRPRRGNGGVAGPRLRQDQIGIYERPGFQNRVMRLDTRQAVRYQRLRRDLAGADFSRRLGCGEACKAGRTVAGEIGHCRSVPGPAPP